MSKAKRREQQRRRAEFVATIVPRRPGQPDKSRGDGAGLTGHPTLQIPTDAAHDEDPS